MTVGPVVDYYVRLLTADKLANRVTREVPPELAGCVLAGPGELQEADGRRPLGAVREWIEQAMAAADLTDQQEFAFGAQAGVTEYPAHRQQRQPRPLGWRVPQRRRKRTVGLGERRLRGLGEEAVEEVDRLNPAAPSAPAQVTAVMPDTVPDPATAPWFAALVPDPRARFRWLERAVEAARSFVGASGLGRATEGAMRDLDAYQRALYRADGDWPPRRPLGRSRAHALVGLTLWDLLAARPYDLGMVAALRSGCLDVPRRAALGSENLGRLLAGEVDDATVLAVCAEALVCNRTDHPQARLMADMVLGCYPPSDGRQLGNEARATILRTVVRVRVVDEDPTALGLARCAMADHPNAWQTVDAVQAAMRVAAAYRLYRTAEELYRWADRALQGRLVLAPGRLRQVEHAEFKLWNLHERTVAWRRRLDTGAGHEYDLRTALELADRAHRDLATVLRLNDEMAARDPAARGDATPEWEFFLRLRHAELHFVGATLVEDRRRGDANHLRAAARHGQRAEQVLRSTGLQHDPMSAIALHKVKLRGALQAHEEDVACALVRQIGRSGWPLERTPLTAARFAPAVHRLPRLRDQVRDILSQQRDAAATIVDGTNRRRLAGLVGLLATC